MRVPDRFERQRAAQTRGGQRQHAEGARHAQQQNDERQRQREDCRRIRQWHSHGDKNEQQERQQRGERGELGAQGLRGNAGESEAGERLGQRIFCAAFRCARQKFSHGEESGEEEDRSHSADDDEHGGQFDVSNWNAEDPRRADQNRQRQHRNDGHQRRGRDGESDG